MYERIAQRVPYRADCHRLRRRVFSPRTTAPESRWIPSLKELLEERVRTLYDDADEGLEGKGCPCEAGGYRSVPRKAPCTPRGASLIEAVYCWERVQDACVRLQCCYTGVL